MTQLGKEGFTLEQVIEELNAANEIIDSIMNKYDYSKLLGRKKLVIKKQKIIK